MSTNIILLVTLFAFLGGVANAILAWLSQKPRPPFDSGSFTVSLIISLAAGFGIAETFNYASVTNNILACFAAFISGMGGNGLISGIAGAVVSKPSPSTINLQSVLRGRFIWGAFYRRI